MNCGLKKKNTGLIMVINAYYHWNVLVDVVKLLWVLTVNQNIMMFVIIRLKYVKLMMLMIKIVKETFMILH